MANRKRKPNKPLFQDPFMDPEGMGQSSQGETVDEVAAKVAAESSSKKGGRAAAKAERTTRRKAVAKAKPGSRKRATSKEAAKPKAKKRAAIEAKSKPRTRKRATTKAKVKPQPDKEPTAKVKFQPEAVDDVVVELQSTPDIEPVETIAAPEERTSFLEQLIATIDEEVDEAFGPGAMGDLAPARQIGQAEEEQHVIFTLAGTEYAAHIDNVTEIGDPLNATVVPNVPDWVLGVANLRGDIISMVDMRGFLGMEPTGYGQGRRMVVAQARNEELTTGLIVDQVSGIRHLDVGRISEPTAPIDDQVAPYLRGVYEHDGQLLVVLDFDRLLLSPEMRQF